MLHHRAAAAVGATGRILEICRAVIRKDASSRAATARGMGSERAPSAKQVRRFRKVFGSRVLCEDIAPRWMEHSWNRATMIQRTVSPREILSTPRSSFQVCPRRSRVWRGERPPPFPLRKKNCAHSIYIPEMPRLPGLPGRVCASSTLDTSVCLMDPHESQK